MNVNDKDSDRFCFIHNMEMEPDVILGDPFYDCPKCEEERQMLKEEREKNRKLEVEKIKDENERKRMGRDYESVMERYRLSNLKFRRKLLNHTGNSRMISIPPLFLEGMEALDCKEIYFTFQDRDHIVIELIRPSLPVKEAEEHKDNLSGRN